MPEPSFNLESPSFENGGKIPVSFTCDGRDVSPRLQWTGPPQGTRSYALVVEDPDAPDGIFTHWVLYDIPAELTDLPESANQLGVAGRNDFEEVGYGGPCPPQSHGDHRYYFRLHALDVESLDVPEGATREQIDKLMDGHVLSTAELMGVFRRE